ncbi:MAG: type II toxin-antitoxin system Phd/YefM family antitoxin [Burkholderiaceae bacterium]|nr:type II toxin-antitoxin system Phd/YefM family antitoxin [Burkholderiaceae bacterium]
MALSARDVIPRPQARANLPELAELADQVRAGAEKIITKNGENYIAMIDARRLDYYHQLERERIHLLLINDASQGLADVAAGKVKDARSTLSALQHRRSKAPPELQVCGLYENVLSEIKVRIGSTETMGH